MPMASTYAGILGLTAFVVVVLRGLVDGAGLIGTIQRAMMCLYLLAAVGYVVGALAQRMVDDSVRFRIQEEIDAQEKEAAQQPESAIS